MPSNLCPQDFIANLDKERIVEFATPVYSIRGQKAILIDKFTVKFVPEMSDADIEAFNAKHHVEIVEKKPRPGGTFLYILRITRDSELDALWMPNFYHEQDSTLWAQPGFITYPVTIVKATQHCFAAIWAAIKGHAR